MMLWWFASPIKNFSLVQNAKKKISKQLLVFSYKSKKFVVWNNVDMADLVVNLDFVYLKKMYLDTVLDSLIAN